MKSIFNMSARIDHGFTLIEMLVVIAIIGVLASIGLGLFTSSLYRARDAERKSDLKQLGQAMELFYSDYNRYPQSSSSGQIEACSFNPATRTGQLCDWGNGEFTDGNTLYMRIVPADSSPGRSYVYRVSSNGDRYRIFARLENDQDQDIIVGLTETCGDEACDFVFHSPNTTPTENWGGGESTSVSIYICPYDCQVWNSAGLNCAGAAMNICGFSIAQRTCTPPYTGCVPYSP